MLFVLCEFKLLDTGHLLHFCNQSSHMHLSMEHLQMMPWSKFGTNKAVRLITCSVSRPASLCYA